MHELKKILKNTGLKNISPDRLDPGEKKRVLAALANIRHQAEQQKNTESTLPPHILRALNRMREQDPGFFRKALRNELALPHLTDQERVLVARWIKCELAIHKHCADCGPNPQNSACSGNTYTRSQDNPLLFKKVAATPASPCRKTTLDDRERAQLRQALEKMKSGRVSRPKSSPRQDFDPFDAFDSSFDEPSGDSPTNRDESQPSYFPPHSQPSQDHLDALAREIENLPNDASPSEGHSDQDLEDLLGEL